MSGSWGEAGVGEVKPCEVESWDLKTGERTWKPAWFHGLREAYIENQNYLKAVVRLPGNILLEEFPLSAVRLVEPTDPVDEAELDEALQKEQAKAVILGAKLLRLDNYLNSYEGEGMSEEVKQEMYKILEEGK